MEKLILIALRGLLPEKVAWISELIVDLIEAIPDIIGSKGKLDEASKDKIAEIIADCLDEISEVNSLEAKVLSDAIIIIVDKVIRATEKKRIIKLRRQRKINAISNV